MSKGRGKKKESPFKNKNFIMKGINTMSTSVAVSSRFVLDFANKAIVGSKASFDRAGKGKGNAYEKLVSLMAKHPDFVCVVKEPKEPTKPKQTYKGMDIPFILDYLAAIGDNKTLKRMNDVMDYAKENKLKKYPLVKYELFAAYNEFNYNDAKEIVSVYRHKKIVEMATAEAAKKTASTESKQPDPTPAEKAA